MNFEMKINSVYATDDGDHDEKIETKANNSKVSLMKAYVKMRQDLEQPDKNATAVKGSSKFSYNYTTLDQVIKAINTAAEENGINFIQQPLKPGNEIGVRTYIVHEDGGFMDMGIFTIPAGKTPQDNGSALTYAKRYSLATIFGIASEEDDDAQSVTNSYQRQYNQNSNYGTRQNYQRSNPPKPKKLSREQLEKYTVKFSDGASYTLKQLFDKAQENDVVKNWIKSGKYDDTTKSYIKQLGAIYKAEQAVKTKAEEVKQTKEQSEKPKSEPAKQKAESSKDEKSDPFEDIIGK